MPWPQALADPRRGAADGGELRQAGAVAAPIETIENLWQNGRPNFEDGDEANALP